MGEAEKAERRAALEQKIRDCVEKYGWFCMNVGAGDEEPNFAHSIGFTKTLGAPEAIISGLPFDLQHRILGYLFEQLEGGLELTDGCRIGDLIEGHDCVAKRVTADKLREYPTSAIWFARESGVDPDALRAFQLVWPGKLDSLYPWDTGVHPTVVESQLNLYSRERLH